MFIFANTVWFQIKLTLTCFSGHSSIVYPFVVKKKKNKDETV